MHAVERVLVDRAIEKWDSVHDNFGSPSVPLFGYWKAADRVIAPHS
jgi:hypothetical protein